MKNVRTDIQHVGRNLTRLQEGANQNTRNYGHGAKGCYNRMNMVGRLSFFAHKIVDPLPA